MIGTILDKYEVLQKVGEGGMATVYRGRHTTLDRDVAVKVLHPHLSSSTRNRKRFAREARAIEHLRHDNILEIFDYSGDNAAECYIVTEFVGGETLTTVMDRVGRMPSEVACLIGIYLARALDYAHRSSVLHRDLKPDNVMLRFDGVVKLMDFGIARFLDESQVTMTGALVGSPAFMSPEQAREDDLDARSDLFSLGTVLFYLVTGHLPFTGSNASLILKNIIEGNRPNVGEVNPTISASLADVIERLLQTDREERFHTAAEVGEALERCLTEVGITADDPAWGLSTWLDDPDAYERRLQAHLEHTLLAEGQRLQEQGDHLTSLRLFNRLLSIDEDNAEVLALVQGMHEPETRASSSPGSRIVGVAALALIVVAMGLGWWTLGADTSDLDPETATTATLPPKDTEVRSPEPPEAPPEAPPADTETEPDTDASSGSRTPPSTPTKEPRPDRPPEVVAKARLPGPTRPVDPVRTPADPPEAADAVGYLDVRVIGPPVRITVNGDFAGESRDYRGAIPVMPGKHTVLLTSDITEDYEFEVEIVPGETKRRTIRSDDLTIRPARLRFPGLDGACHVQVGPDDLGTLNELEREIELRYQSHRDTVREVFVRCGDDTYHQTTDVRPGTVADFVAKAPAP